MIYSNKLSITCILLLLLNQSLQAQHTHSHSGPRADSHAPISVMAEHTHGKNEIMLSYRYMYMDMDGMQNRTDSVSSNTVFNNNYTITPTRMTMEMHMFGMMYAPTDNLTLMAMASYRETEMDHVIFQALPTPPGFNAGNPNFTTRTEGFGDVKLSGLFKFYDKDAKRSHFTLGISLPTGSIGEQDKVPGPGGILDRQLPAPMQLGSGTVDILPSITFTNHANTDYSYGFQVGGVIRTGKNHHDYRLGHEFNTKTWAAYNLANWISLTGRLGYHYQTEMKGTQSDLLTAPPFAPTRRTVTTAFSENYGGSTADAGIGINLLGTSGPVKGHRLAVEFSAPFFQDLNGFQLETTYVTTVGWQYAW